MSVNYMHVYPPPTYGPLPTPYPGGPWLTDAVTKKEVPMAMQHLHLAGRVTPAGGLMQVTHTFKCEGEMPLEVLYSFALPRTGALRRFHIKGSGFDVKSELKLKEKARETYEKGIEDGHLSALAETYSDGVMTLTLGQLSPGEEVKVVLEIFCGVDAQDSSFRFRFPFTLAPSYHKSAKASCSTIELPEEVFGDLILPEWKTGEKGLHAISFKIHVDSGVPLASVGSPSHRVEVNIGDDGKSAEVVLAGASDLPNRDLVLEVRGKTEKPILFADKSFLKGKAAKKGGKTPPKAPRWSAIIPSSMIPKGEEKPRRVIFVLDRSGSMGGKPIESAKLALSVCLSALGPKDEFGIVAFDTLIEELSSVLLKATKNNRKKAVDFLANIGARGGTDLDDGLAAAEKILKRKKGEIFLLTDGQVWETGPIMERVRKTEIIVHVMGIGIASQDRFLAQLARKTGGIQRMVGSSEDVGFEATKMFNAIKFPVREGVSARIRKKSGLSSQISQVGTIWGGKAVIVTDKGGLRAIPTGIKFSWSGGSIDVPISKISKTPDGLIALLWAGREIEDLESALDYESEEESKEEIRETLQGVSMAFGLASKEASHCAVVKRKGDEGKKMKQVVAPVGMPEGMQQAFSQPVVVNHVRAMMGGSGMKHAVRGQSMMRSFSGVGDPTNFAVSCSTQSLSGGSYGFVGKVPGLTAINPDWDSLCLGGSDHGAPLTEKITFVKGDSFLADLLKLEDDGSAFGFAAWGTFIEFLATALLALRSLQKEEEEKAYDGQRKRMASFLEKNIPTKEIAKKDADSLIHAILSGRVLEGGWEDCWEKVTKEPQEIWGKILSSLQ